MKFDLTTDYRTAILFREIFFLLLRRKKKKMIYEIQEKKETKYTVDMMLCRSCFVKYVILDKNETEKKDILGLFKKKHVLSRQAG